jgi:YidC/Oxa1 family membrane protein insertase
MAELWDIIILNPVLNSLIALSTVLWNNFGLSIIALTIVIRLILMPLTIKQTQSTKAMQSLQPKLQELQKKYARNQEKLQQEMMALYKEAGVNPLGCMWPMLIQFPVWIALYQSIMRALAATPEDLLDLGKHLYSWPMVTQAIPLNERFLWLSLSVPDSYMVLAILTGVTMWIQQKMVTPPATDPKQQSMTQITTLMMPLMFAMFTLSFPSGLALYWVVSNIIGIVIQYFVQGGWGYMNFPSLFKPAPQQPQPQQQKLIQPAEQQSKTIKKAEDQQKKKGFFNW